MTSHAVPDIIELDAAQLEALLLRVEAGQLTPEDVETLIAALKSYAYVTQLIDQKSTTIGRLRKLLFGSQTDKDRGRHRPGCRAVPARSPWPA
jgi:hypothetical protein